MSQISKNELKAENQLQFPNNNNGAITPSRLRAFNVDMIDSTVNQSDFTSFSGSVAAQLAQATGSVTSAITGSSLITASFNNGTRNLTFTKGDATQFSVNIPDVSGSTGNFATTGSNSFVGDQTITGSLIVSGGAVIDLRAAGTYLGGARLNLGDFENATFSNLNDFLVGFNGDAKFFGDSVQIIGPDPSFTLIDSTAPAYPAYAMRSKDAQLQFVDGVNGVVMVSMTTASVNISSSVTASNTLINGDLTVNPNTKTTLNGNTDIGAFLYINGGLTLNTPAEIRWVGVSGSINSTFSQSVDARINAITGSGGINTGSFATTGSNTFTGNQTITNPGNAQLTITSTGGGQANVEFQAPNNNFTAYGDFNINNNGQYGGSGSIKILAKDNNIILAADGGFQLGQTNGIGNGIGAGAVTINVPTGSNQLQLTGSLNVSNSLTASLQQGYVWVGDSNNITTLVATSSFGSTIDTGSFATTGSNTFTGDQQITNSRISITGQSSDGPVWLLGNSGSLVIGNNAQTPTYAALSHITSSQPNANTNIIIKHNNLSNSLIVSGSRNIFANPDSLAAGRVGLITNGNIFTHAGGIVSLTGSAASVTGSRPTVNGNFYTTTGGTPYFITSNQSVNGGAHTYSGNIGSGNSFTINALGSTGTINMSANVGTFSVILNAASRSIAEINAGATGSNNVNMNTNIGAGAGSLTYNGPVSQSAAQAHAINSNYFGSGLTMNVQSGSRNYTVSSNTIQGFVTINDNTVFAPQLGSSNTIQANITTGFTVNNRASSSFQVSNNVLGGASISSDLDTSLANPIAQRVASVTNNNLNGASNNIYFSGSMGAVSGSRQFTGNVVAGLFNSASLVGDGLSKSLLATTIQGGFLNVLGTNTTTFGASPINMGSAFFGRYNAEDGTRNSTAETIFAVGTGISGSGGLVRKTGFLIDSGSNTFIEGTLNVSGSSVFTGSVFISSSATNDLVVNGRIFVSSSATSGTGTPIITISGSQGVTLLQRNLISTQNLTSNAQLNPFYVLTSNLSTFDEIGLSIDPVGGGIAGWSAGPVLYTNDPTDSYPAMFGFQNKANWTDGRITALKPLVVSGSFNVLGNSTLSGSLNIAGGMNVVSPGGQTARFTSIDTTTARVKETLAFTGSRFVVGALSTSVDMENLSSTVFGFNQLDVADGQTGAQFLLETNKAANYSEVKLNARYTGSNDANVQIRNTNTGASTFTVNATTSTLNSSFYIQSSSVNLPTSTGSAILTWNASTGQVSQASFSSIVSASVSSAEFWSTTTQSGSAGVSGSLSFNNSGSFYNVSLVNGTQLTVANAGVYNIQFSAQIETSAGADTMYVWFKKNGTNIGDSASKAVLANNTAQIMTVNILDEAQANDYYEIAYQTLNGNARILAEAASGNIPAIPSVITTITQVR